MLYVVCSSLEASRCTHLQMQAWTPPPVAAQPVEPEPSPDRGVVVDGVRHHNLQPFSGVGRLVVCGRLRQVEDPRLVPHLPQAGASRRDARLDLPRPDASESVEEASARRPIFVRWRGCSSRSRAVLVRATCGARSLTTWTDLTLDLSLID